MITVSGPQERQRSLQYSVTSTKDKQQSSSAADFTDFTLSSSFVFPGFLKNDV